MKARQPALAIGLAIAILAAVQVQAAGSLPPSAQRTGDSSPSCESARLSAWFERQRQITDGDVDPQKPVLTPVECLRTADSGAAREQQAASVERHDRAAMPVRVQHGPRG